MAPIQRLPPLLLRQQNYLCHQLFVSSLLRLHQNSPVCGMLVSQAVLLGFGSGGLQAGPVPLLRQLLEDITALPTSSSSPSLCLLQRGTKPTGSVSDIQKQPNICKAGWGFHTGFPSRLGPSTHSQLKPQQCFSNSRSTSSNTRFCASGTGRAWMAVLILLHSAAHAGGSHQQRLV